MRRICYILVIVYNICFFFSCNSPKKELQDAIEQMQSRKIAIPYEQMNCWANDSILKVSPWEKAKLKLVHYIDSATCSSCYLQKVKMNDYLFRMEELSNNEFYNVIIINPGNKMNEELEKLFSEKLIPQTIFIDSTNNFAQVNPNIPHETKYHTFLVDDNNKVILVGNPIVNKKIKDIFMSIVEERLGIKLNFKNLDKLR